MSKESIMSYSIHSISMQSIALLVNQEKNMKTKAET